MKVLSNTSLLVLIDGEVKMVSRNHIRKNNVENGFNKADSSLKVQSSGSRSQICYLNQP